MAAKKLEQDNVVTLDPIEVKHATIRICGEGDLVLNKINAAAFRELTAEDRKAQKLWEAQHNNKWERIITSIHWRDPLPIKGDNSDGLATNRECSEEMFFDLLKNNAPCISAMGLKASWGDAVVRNEIDTYATKFKNAVNITAKGGLIPIKFAEWSLDVRPMTGKGKQSSAITAMLNHFSGWSADVPIAFTEHVYSSKTILTIINYAGFGLGIGSGRSSGYGRYTIQDATM